MKHISKDEIIGLLKLLADLSDRGDRELRKHTEQAIETLLSTSPAMTIEIERDPKYGGPSLEVLRFDDLGDGKHQLFALPFPPAKAQEYGGAYQGAREDLAIWKRRALEAEAELRRKDQIIDRLASESQGETRFGEPSLPVKAQVPELTDDDILAVARNPDTCPVWPWWLKADVTAEEVRALTLRFAKALLERFNASPAPGHRGDDNEMVELLEWIASGKTSAGCYSSWEEVDVIKDRVVSFLDQRHRQQEKTER